MDSALVLWAPHGGPLGRGFLRYDVCLSFAGVSEGSFLGRLRASLAAEGVSVCTLKASQAVCSSPQLPEAVIRWSKICIPILSKDYASSEQCLRGLVQMMEGKIKAGQAVLPIFDRVEPSDVRYQKGSFGKAILPFDGAEMERMKGALFLVSFLYGWRMTEGREEELVKRVVQTVLRRLRPDLHNVGRSSGYNVFLNFRGADTRHGLADRIYNGLRDAGVSVFKDDADLPIGEDIRSQLHSTIKRSLVNVAIVSPNYASSKWCLGELTQMLECRLGSGRFLIPVFCQVEPRDVRRPRALSSCRTHLGASAIRNAQETLEQVALMKGFITPSGEDEERLIRKLVTELVRMTLIKLWRFFQVDVPVHVIKRY